MMRTTGEIGALSVRTVLKGHVRQLRSNGSPFVLATIELAGGAPLSVYVTRMAVAELKLAPGVEVRALIKSVSIDERGVAGHRDGAPRGD